jgi:YgiT-type zinc finger domain-containing protein
MYCDVCKVEMNDSTTVLELKGKENMVNVEKVPCSACPQCGARVVDGITMGIAKKSAGKCKDNSMDFEKMGGIGVMAGKITL